MNIMCCVNEKYMYPMINLLYSIRKNNGKHIELFLLTTQFSFKAEKIVRNKCEKIDVNVTIIRKKLNEEFNVGELHYSLDMYLRILSFSLLPSDVDKVLYLDADMIALKNIDLIYEQPLNNKLMAVVEDVNSQTEYMQRHKLKLGINHIYFNSGMILFNIELIRKMWKIEHIEHLIMERRLDFLYPDQDCLNLLCQESDFVLLDEVYNCQKFRRDTNVNVSDIVILHYVGDAKPWNRFFAKNHEKLFWQNFKHVGCCKFYWMAFGYKISNTTKRIFRRIKRIFMRRKGRNCRE